MTDRHGLAIGLPMAAAILLKKQIQYRYSHGIGIEISCSFFELFGRNGFFLGNYENFRTPFIQKQEAKKANMKV